MRRWLERMEKNKIEDILRTKGRIVTTAEGNGPVSLYTAAKGCFDFRKTR